MNEQQIRDKLIELQEATKSIIASAEGEQRDLTTEELDQVEVYSESFESFKKQLEARTKLTSQNDFMSTSAGRRTAPVVPATQSSDSAEIGGELPTGGRTRNDDTKKWGFRSVGEQAIAIRAAAAMQIGSGYLDKRLEARAPTTFGSEGVGADGGFALAPDFRDEIMAQVFGEESLVGRTNQLTTSSNSVTVPTDESTPWQSASSGGIQAYWEGEADQFTQSKPQLKKMSIDLPKVTVMVPVTDELLEDAPGIAAYLNRKAPENIDFKFNFAIVQGTGVGMPLGILNSPATVEVAKVGSQVADTVVGLNISAMWARMYSPRRRNAIWLINQDIEPQLDALMKVGKLDTGGADTGWGAHLFLPAGGFSGSPFDTLKGRPIIPTEACNTLGDAGDIILADLSQYASAKKVQGLRADTSIHLWFDFDLTAFRFILRGGGRPWLSAPISPRTGNNTLSPFVTLAARA